MKRDNVPTTWRMEAIGKYINRDVIAGLNRRLHVFVVHRESVAIARREKDGANQCCHRYACSHLTRSRRENPAFNYGFFLSNPLEVHYAEIQSTGSWPTLR